MFYFYSLEKLFNLLKISKYLLSRWRNKGISEKKRGGRKIMFQELESMLIEYFKE